MGRIAVHTGHPAALVGRCARLETVVACAALSETDKSAWYREHGLYAGELEQ